MRRGLVFVHFFALVATVTAALLSREWSRREFPDLRSTRQTKGTRCLRLSAGDSAADWFPMPPVVALDTSRSLTSPLTSWTHDWFAARALVRSNAERRALEPMNVPPRWRPAGPDSIDIAVPSFPVSARLRISDAGDTTGGRLVLYDDVSIVLPFNGTLHMLDWPPVDFVRVVGIPCPSLPPANVR